MLNVEIPTFSPLHNKKQIVKHQKQILLNMFFEIPTSLLLHQLCRVRSVRKSGKSLHASFMTPVKLSVRLGPDLNNPNLSSRANCSLSLTRPLRHIKISNSGHHSQYYRHLDSVPRIIYSQTKQKTKTNKRLLLSKG